MSARIFRYIRHSDVPDWEAAGWHNLRCLGGTSHGEWSELMEWRGEGEPKDPRDCAAPDPTRVA